MDSIVVLWIIFMHTWSLAANNFVVELTFQDGKVVVTAQLPVFITGSFSLRVRFYSTEQVPREEEIVISDSSLADTRDIDIVIPRERLPCFRSFSVAVAIGSSNEQGEFTTKTNSIGKSTYMQYKMLCNGQ